MCLQAGAGKKAGMTADQVAIIARLKANNAQLNLRPELRGELKRRSSPYASCLQKCSCGDEKHEVACVVWPASRKLSLCITTTTPDKHIHRAVNCGDLV